MNIHDMLQVLMRKGGLYAKLVMTLVYRAIVDLPCLCDLFFFTGEESKNHQENRNQSKLDAWYRKTWHTRLDVPHFAVHQMSCM